MSERDLVSVSSYVKDKLDKIKKKEDHRTYDSVIRMLISIYEESFPTMAT